MIITTTTTTILIMMLIILIHIIITMIIIIMKKCLKQINSFLGPRTKLITLLSSNLSCPPLQKKIQNNMDKYGVNAGISLIFAERLLLQPKVNFFMHCLRCERVTGLPLPCKLGLCKAQSSVTY